MLYPEYEMKQKLTIFLIALFFLPQLLSAQGVRDYDAPGQVKLTKYGRQIEQQTNAATHQRTKQGGNEIQADHKYVYFNNLAGQQLSNVGVFTYYDNINADPTYQGKILNAEFNDQFFAQNEITDFDVAIFYMGSNPLSAQTTSGNYVVIDKIMEMIDAGKEVIVIGWSCLWWQYDDAAPPFMKNPKVDSFFSDKLGIKYKGRFSQMNGNTYDSLMIIGSRRGNVVDSITKGLYKFCNRGIGNLSPLVYVSATEGFTLNDGGDGISIDHYDAITNPVLCGSRVNLGDSRIVFWSYGFEFVAGNLSREIMIQSAMDWVLAPNYEPGALFDYIGPEKIDFGFVEAGSSVDTTLEFANIGAKTLVISDIKIDWNEEGVYKILEGGDTPISLEPYESHQIKIRFTPPGEDTYKVFVVLETNAENYATPEFTLEGNGGKRFGAYMTTNVVDNTIDFGYSPRYKAKDFDLVIENTGENPLDIYQHELKGENGDNMTFKIIKGDSYPTTIEPGQTHTKTIRFSPPEEGKTFRATLELNTNATNSQGSTFIYKLIGRGGLAPGARIETNLENQHKLDFGTVAKGIGKTDSLELINVGNIPMNVSSLDIDPGEDDVFSIVTELGYPVVIGPDSSVTIEVKFMPVKPKTISTGMISIFSTALNENPFELELYGISDKSTSVDAEASTANGLLTIMAAPNPAEMSSSISYELIGDAPKSIDMYIVDMSGRRVLELMGRTVTPGSYRLEAGLSAFASGTYYVIANMEGSLARIPLLIVR